MDTGFENSKLSIVICAVCLYIRTQSKQVTRIDDITRQKKRKKKELLAENFLMVALVFVVIYPLKRAYLLTTVMTMYHINRTNVTNILMVLPGC